MWKKTAGAQDYYGPGYDTSLGTGEGKSGDLISYGITIEVLLKLTRYPITSPRNDFKRR